MAAPLSAVARQAGVGQGSLYRHFPDRVSLALAVFEENVAELEELAASEEGSLDACLDLITAQTIGSIAFVDIITSAAEEDDRIETIAERVRRALAQPLREARKDGTLRRSASSYDVMLAIGMMSAIVARTPAPDRRRTARQCWAILRSGISA